MELSRKTLIFDCKQWLWGTKAFFSNSTIEYYFDVPGETKKIDLVLYSRGSKNRVSITPLAEVRGLIRIEGHRYLSDNSLTQWLNKYYGQDGVNDLFLGVEY